MLAPEQQAFPMQARRRLGPAFSAALTDSRERQPKLAPEASAPHLAPVPEAHIQRLKAAEAPAVGRANSFSSDPS